MSEQSTSGSSSVLKSTGLGLVVGFVIPVLVIAALVKFTVSSHDSAHRSGPTMSEQAIAQRLKPVGQLAVAGAPPSSVSWQLYAPTKPPRLKNFGRFLAIGFPGIVIKSSGIIHPLQVLGMASAPAC